MKLTGLGKNWIAEDIVRIADGCISGRATFARPRHNWRVGVVGKLPSLSGHTQKAYRSAGSRERHRQTIDACCG
jgi:hypothetical protein